MNKYMDGEWHLWNRNEECPVPLNTNCECIFLNPESQYVRHFIAGASSIVWNTTKSDGESAPIHSFRVLDAVTEDGIIFANDKVRQDYMRVLGSKPYTVKVNQIDFEEV